MRWRAAVAATAAACVVLAGCGGSSDDDNGKTQTGSAAATKTQAVDGTASGSRGSSFDPQAIYKNDSEGVVTILAAEAGGQGGLGSGFVISDSGEIATNAHVVTTGEGAAIHQASEVFVRFGDGNQVSGKIVGFDPFSDVALVKVDPQGLTLKPLALGSIDDVQVGEPVAAIGSPFGEERSLSVGVISATDRSIESLTGFATIGALQTDAAINSGNSGGPLLDGEGRVLGINSQIRSSSGTGSGVGFAVPVDIVKRSVDQLRETGTVKYPYLGVSTSEVYPQLNEHYHLGTDRGAWIQTVVPNGPGDKAGLRAGTRRSTFQQQEWRVGGDVVTKVDDQEVATDSDLARMLVDHQPGDTVQMTIVRGGKTQTIPVKLGTRPLQSPSG